MISYLLCFLISLCITLFTGSIFVPVLKRLKAGQTILKYVETHKYKNGTPTFGGLFFILSSVFTYGVLERFDNRLTLVSVVIGIAFMTVGFLDDFIKIRYSKNEGLKPYQKIIFQSCISLVVGVFSYVNGITELNIPFSNKTINIDFFIIPLIFVVFIATTNSVNLIDGLDGLAGSVSFVYLIFLALIIFFQNSLNGQISIEANGLQLIKLIFCLTGGILGFLFFNVSKAQVFMGDTGSLSLGGFIGALSIFSKNVLVIPILGLTFVLTALSVIVQVFHYKRTKQRIFLMTPIHHHFQIKGFTETQISFSYSLLTCIIGLLLIICYL